MYAENTANYPRLKSDVFFADYRNYYKYSGFMNDAFTFVEKAQVLDADLWAKFVHQFRSNADDHDAGWRGEFWGKMMRGAAFVYSYTRNRELYEALKKTVIDMMDSADAMGRISTYSISREFDGWDMWSRKYVILGMQYFLEVCEDKELSARIVHSMCAQLDYVIRKIGPSSEGKKEITLATRHWRGLNSSSMLEPVVRLYNITKNEQYLDFAKYIVSCGATDIVDIFELAYKNEFSLYQYPITKAYEMTSCFEGLLEFYRITGDEKHKTAVINFANRILEEDFTVIGCCGCTHELFDHSTVRQANTTNEKIQQETCVTVTLMKFFYQVTLLTGDPKYVDAFEISLYNAYLGSLNTEGALTSVVVARNPEWNHIPMPFDSYNPLTADMRGKEIGGMKYTDDNSYYGCCACIGAAGIGLVPKMQLLSLREGFVLNLFVNGLVKTHTPYGNDACFYIETEYPKNGSVKIRVEEVTGERFKLYVRIPAWSKATKLCVNGETVEVSEGYTVIDRVWFAGDVVTLELDMRTEAIYPIPYGSQVTMTHVIWGHNYMIPVFDREDPIARNHIALRRGPVILAQDSRLGYSLDTPIGVKVGEDGYVDVRLTEGEAPYKDIIEAKIPLDDGSEMLATDYSSAGKKWTEDNKMAAWMLTK